MRSHGHVDSSLPPLRGWRGDAAALVAGLILPLAFSPFFLWYLVLPSAGTLFATWLQVTARRAAWRGWLYGVAAFGTGVSWIVHSFQFSNIALWLALLLTVGFVAFLALFPALTGAALVHAGRRVALPLRLAGVFPAGWILSEWLRGWFLTGFTWLQLGYSQVDGPLSAWLPLSGVYGTGLSLAACGGTLAWLALRPGLRPALTLGALVLVLAALSALGARDWTRPAGRALSVALMQGNVPQDQKWLPRMREPTLDRYLRLAQPHLGTDLLVWPETALPARRSQLDGFVERLDRIAAAAGSSVLFGAPEVVGEPPRAYNSVFMVGASRGRYRKRHLVPFGEYLPANALLRPVTRALRIPVSSFAPGPADQPLLGAAGHRLAVFVCYEIAFGNEVIRALPEAALLVTVSNDAWFGDSIGPHQHLQMARARSLETGRDLLRATNTGITAVVAASGEVLGRLDQFRIATLSGEVTPRQGATPYVRTGDAPALVLCALLLMPCVLVRRRGWREAGRA